MNRARLAAVFATSALAGCSLFVGLDGLQGSTDDGTDASFADVVLSDGGSSEASFDSSSSSDAAIRFCANQPSSVAFCDDFDDPSASTPDSSVIEVGSIGIASDIVKTAPHSLHVVQHVNDAGTGVEADYRYTTGPLTKIVTAEFDVYMASLDPTTGGHHVAFLQELAVDGGGDRQQMSLYFADTTLHLGEIDVNGAQTSHPTVPNDVTDTAWHHVLLRLDMSSKTAKITLEIDGVTVEQDNAKLLWVPEKVAFCLGFSSDGTGYAADGYFDDVTVDVQQ